MGRLIDADRVCQGNCTECHDYDICNIYNAPTVEAIPKDQYEKRLKVDMVAMLEEIKDEANNIRSTIWNCTSFTEGIMAYNKLIQQKINELEEQKDGNND